MLCFLAPGKTTPHKTVANGPFLYYKWTDRVFRPWTKYPTWGIPSVRPYYKQKHGVFRPPILPHMGYSVHLSIYPRWGIPSVRPFYPMSAHFTQQTWGILSAVQIPHMEYSVRPAGNLPHMGYSIRKGGIWSVRTFYPTL